MQQIRLITLAGRRWLYLAKIRSLPFRLVKMKCAADDVAVAHGSVVIASITSCTNTSNPASYGAGLLAKKAWKELEVKPFVKTSLSPDPVVTITLKLLTDTYLEALGFIL